MFTKVFLPIIIIIGALYGFYYLKSTPVKAMKKQNMEEKSISYKELEPNLILKTMKLPFMGKVVSKEYSITSEVEGKIIFQKDKLEVGTEISKEELIFIIDNNDLKENLDKKENEKVSMELDIDTLKTEIKNLKEEIKISGVSENKYLLKENELTKLQLSLNTIKIEIKNLKEEIEKSIFKLPVNSKIFTLNVKNNDYITANKVIGTYIEADKSYIELEVPSYISSFSLDKNVKLISKFPNLSETLSSKYLLSFNKFKSIGAYVKLFLSFDINLFQIPKDYVYNGYVITKTDNNYTKNALSYETEDENFYYTKENYIKIFKKVD